MIFYFSGTGNSYHTARKLAEGLGDRLVNMAEAAKAGNYAYTLAPGEKLGFVFPVYAWAPPKAVEDFIQNLELYYTDDIYTYAVCTCGQSAGETMSILEGCLEENGLSLDSGFSVVMPDNYVVMFRVDSPEEQRKKWQHADEVIQLILRAVKLEKKDFFRVKKGRGSFVKSNVINPLFRRFATRTDAFYPTVNCIGCGLCAQICTSGCITMAAGVPVWEEDRCNMCLACLHRCPQHAIQYGKKTVKKGRYLHPDYQKRFQNE